MTPRPFAVLACILGVVAAVASTPSTVTVGGDTDATDVAHERRSVPRGTAGALCNLIARARCGRCFPGDPACLAPVYQRCLAGRDERAPGILGKTQADQCVDDVAAAPCNDKSLPASCTPCPAETPAWTGSCVECGGGSAWDGRWCSCPAERPLYVEETHECLPCPGETFGYDGRCVCPSDRPVLNPETSTCSACVEGTTWDGEACRCPLDAPLWDDASGRCVACRAGAVNVDGTCYCAVETPVPLDDGSCGPCPAGMRNKDGACVNDAGGMTLQSFCERVAQDVCDRCDNDDMATCTAARTAACIGDRDPAAGSGYDDGAVKECRRAYKKLSCKAVADQSYVPVECR